MSCLWLECCGWLLQMWLSLHLRRVLRRTRCLLFVPRHAEWLESNFHIHLRTYLHEQHFTASESLCSLPAAFCAS